MDPVSSSSYVPAGQSRQFAMPESGAGKGNGDIFTLTMLFELRNKKHFVLRRLFI